MKQEDLKCRPQRPPARVYVRPSCAQAFGDDSSDEGSSEDDSDTATDDGGDVDDMSTSAESVERAERSGGDDDHTNPRSSLEDGPPLLLNSGEDGTGDNLQQQPQSVDDELVLSPCKTRTAGETLDTSTYGAAASTSSGAPESLATSIRTRRPRAPPQTTSEKRTAVAVASRTPIAAPAAPPEEAKYQDDHEYLDSIIAELQLRNTGNIDGGGDASEKDTMVGTLSPLAQLLRCDVRCLKLENELRRKFGSSVRPGGGGAGAAGGDGDVGGAGRARRRRGLMPRGGGNNASGASLALKRLVVSAPKDDWPKPPSLVGGGLGMSRCEEGAPEYLPAWQVKAHQGAEWFVFERSESLQQMQVNVFVFFFRGSRGVELRIGGRLLTYSIFSGDLVIFPLCTTSQQTSQIFFFFDFFFVLFEICSLFQISRGNENMSRVVVGFYHTLRCDLSNLLQYGPRLRFGRLSVSLRSFPLTACPVGEREDMTRRKYLCAVQ